MSLLVDHLPSLNYEGNKGNQRAPISELKAGFKMWVCQSPAMCYKNVA